MSPASDEPRRRNVTRVWLPDSPGKFGALPPGIEADVWTGGDDNILPYIPANITLCNARGAHTAATAEWTVGAIVASLRNFPRFAVAQRDGRWDWAQSEAVG